MQIKPRAISIAILILLISIVAGCGDGQGDSAGSRGPASTNAHGTFPPHLRIYYTAATVGRMFPCGCRIPLGGLSRRAAVIKQDVIYPELIIDAGSFTSSSTGYGLFETEWLLKGYKLLGYDAVNLGSAETRISINQLREWDATYGGMFVSANLYDNLDHPITRTYIIKDIEGLKVGITGITIETIRPADAEELPVVKDPAAVLPDVLDAMDKEGADYIILLADDRQAAIDAYAEMFPQIDFIVQGHDFSSHSAVEPRTLNDGNTLAVIMGDQGKHLGRIRIDFEPDGTITDYENERIDLDTTQPTDTDMTLLLVDFKDELRSRRSEFDADPGNPFQRASSPDLIDVVTGYAGENFCHDCHGSLGLETEARMTHGVAFSRLSVEDQQNPDCIQCHSTGYGQPTGFRSFDLDPHLATIGCEACHGPAATHVREKSIEAGVYDADSALPPDNPVDIPFTGDVPEEICLRCHTEEWSPDFDYDTWVVRVNHSGRTGDPIINSNTGEIVGSGETDDPE